MKVLKLMLWAALAVAVMAGCFVIGILVGFRYGDFNKLPFVAGGEWTIGIYTGATPFDLASAEGIENPVLHPDDVTDMPARQVADPFMVQEDGRWYMFFEILHARTEQGDIGYATSDDGLNWDYGSVIIDEAYHLSYPNVFKYQDQYYMIPESNQANAIYLYRADEFPSKWSKVDQILARGGVDPTFFMNSDTCWMFLSSRNRATLMLFYAETPMGPWLEHPLNPLVKYDRTYASPAGPVFEYEGKLYRPAMNCGPDYGYEVRVFEIETLSATDYREREIEQSPVVGATGEGWSKDRMHHLDPHQLEDGSWVACVDGWAKVVQIGLKY